jgi:hypothetical protein
MSETGLAVTNNTRPGVDFSKSIFRLTPKTLSINQPTTRDESAIKGKLRIAETGKQFDSVRVVLLVEPKEQRQYRIGEKGNNFDPENLVCFCSDVKRTPDGRKELSGPSAKAKMPQAMLCSACPKASWDRYRAKKDKNQPVTEGDFPECESFYKLLLLNLDDHNKPLYMYVRGKSRRPFEKGLSILTEMLFDIQSEGITPEVYYVSFVIKAKKDPDNTKTTTYIMDLSDFQVVTPEQIEKFNTAFDGFATQAAAPVETEQKQITDAQTGIEDAIAGNAVAATTTTTVDKPGAPVVESAQIVEAEYISDGADEEIPV